MDTPDLADIMRRIGQGRGIITPSQAIIYQEEEINKYRKQIDDMETEIKARAEIESLKKKNREYRKVAEDDAETVIRINSRDIDNVEIYFKERKSK